MKEIENILYYRIKNKLPKKVVNYKFSNYITTVICRFNGFRIFKEIK